MSAPTKISFSSIAFSQVQVFEYADANAAKADAARVSPDGNSIGTPHFFQSDKLVVLYVGDGKTVQDALARQLGAPFAGK